METSVAESEPRLGDRSMQILGVFGASVFAFGDGFLIERTRMLSFRNPPIIRHQVLCPLGRRFNDVLRSTTHSVGD